MKSLMIPIFILLIQYRTPMMASEIIDVNSGKQITSFIKDVEIQDMLEETKEFRTCRDKYKFDATITDPSEKNKRIQAAEKCFKDEISKGSKDSKKLEELSRKLDLENYQLVKSKNIKDIQKYLDDKMYKSLTGVDRDEKDLQKLQEDLKFGRKKIIDQAIFLELFKTQLGKNALYEVSRFCFENLRKNSTTTGESFADYWSSYSPNSLVLDNLNDSGNPKFGTLEDTSDKRKIYSDIFKSIQGSNGKGLSDQQLSNFFFECGKLIVPMCEKFKSTINMKSISTSKVDQNKSTLGASACISKSRIQEYKKTMMKAEKIAESLDKMANDEKSLESLEMIIAGLNGEPIKFYGDGKDSNEESIDELTNYTSIDMLENNQISEELQKEAKKCSDYPELATCEGLISKGEYFEKAKHNIEMEMTLKREVEMEKVRKIVQDDKSNIKKYLEENGYYDILKKYDDQTLSDKDIAEEVGKTFEAKKIALLEQINAKLGKRQASSNGTSSNNHIPKSQVNEVVNEAKEERARLAQVVLFHNIISSHLELQDKNKKTVGTNINVWKREEKALESAQIDSSLFQNIKSSNAGSSGLGKDSKISGFVIIDNLLGKEEETK